MTLEIAALNEAPFPSPEALGVGPSIAASEWVVMKFGGTSVSSRANWLQIVARIRQRQSDGLKVFIVHSAFAGVSNALEALIRNPASAIEQGERIIELHHDHAASFGARCSCDGRTHRGTAQTRETGRQRTACAR